MDIWHVIVQIDVEVEEEAALDVAVEVASVEEVVGVMEEDSGEGVDVMT